MTSFRLLRGRRLGIAPSRPGCGRARTAVNGRRRWLAALAGASLAAIVAGWPAMLAGPSAAGSSAAGSSAAGPRASGPGAFIVLTAMRVKQARVLNPGPPTGLTATAGNGQVALSWTAPASDGGAALAGYDVHLGTSAHGESATPVNTGLIAATSYTVTGLTNGTTYYFTADAVNDSGLRSVASAEVSASPAAPVTAPGAPAGLSATPGDAQVTLSWTAPASDGGTQVTSYNIYAGTSQAFTDIAPVVSSKGTSVTVKNLANGTTYYFRVTAVNKVGEGPASGAVSAAPASAITAPGPPGGLTATPGNGRVVLSWTAPASDGGAGISGYLIYTGTSPGGESASPVNGSPVSSTSYTVTGLANGTTYYFEVAAVNDAKHQGKDSPEASAVPVSATASASGTASASQTSSPGAPGVPGAPAALTATPGNAQVSLSWTAPVSAGGSPLASYRVYQGTSPGFALDTLVRSTTNTSATVTGLTNGTTYYFVVTAVDANGQVGGASSEASAEPTGTALLAANKVPKPVIISLAALAVGATAGAAALALRRLRPRSHPPLAPPPEVRAVPDPGLPPLVSVHELGIDETYTVRLEPLAAAIITTIETIEEIRS